MELNHLGRKARAYETRKLPLLSTPQLFCVECNLLRELDSNQPISD